ncbi:MAG: dehydrogenase [Solirubrobacteraceae bacterium]|nr:dehydrogenase [Solirubrobacteraceae bacterium]
MPTELLEAMGNYVEEMVKAGVLLAADGLHPSAKGAHVSLRGRQADHRRPRDRDPPGLRGRGLRSVTPEQREKEERMRAEIEGRA